MKAVAHLAGVSVATVSNVVNHPERVLPATRQRVERAMITLNFVPNAAARHLRSGATNVVGCVLIDLGNPYFTELARGMEDRLIADDWFLLLCSSDAHPERQELMIQRLLQQQVRGIIVTPSGPPAALDGLAHYHVPIILVGADSGQHTFSSVGLDDARGGWLAVAHLLEQGHRRIAVVNGPHEMAHCRVRWQGAVQACTDAGLAAERVLTEYPVASIASASGELAMTRILATEPGVTAVSCIGDLLALGAMRCLRARGLTMPRDMAVVGFDDIALARELSVPLTSVRQPQREMGAAAAELIINPLAEPTRLVFQPELIVRTSTTGRPVID